MLHGSLEHTPAWRTFAMGPKQGSAASLHRGPVAFRACPRVAAVVRASGRRLVVARMDALATADMAVYAGRQKRPSWSDDERLRLVQEIADRIDVIRGKLGPTLTLRAKRSAWNQVQQALNARNRTHTRTLPEIKKQWSNLVQRCKHRVQAHGRADQLPQRSGRQGKQEKFR